MIESRPERGARVYGNVPIASIVSVQAFHLAQALFRGGSAHAAEIDVLLGCAACTLESGKQNQSGEPPARTDLLVRYLLIRRSTFLRVDECPLGVAIASVALIIVGVVAMASGTRRKNSQDGVSSGVYGDASGLNTDYGGRYHPDGHGGGHAGDVGHGGDISDGGGH